MDQLVETLSKSQHTAEILQAKTALELKEQVDRKWINMKFIDIGTSITFQIDEAQSDYVSGDYEKGKGSVKFVGKHTLNYEPVWVTININLATMKAKAQLEMRDVQSAPTEAEAAKLGIELKPSKKQPQITKSTQTKTTTSSTPKKKSKRKTKAKLKPQPKTKKSSKTKPN